MTGFADKSPHPYFYDIVRKFEDESEPMKRFQTKLTSKGQLTLPVEIRKSLGVGPGDHIEFLVHRGEVVVHARNRPASAIFGKAAAYARPVTRERYDRLVGDAIAARGKPVTQRASHKGRKTG